MMSFQNHVDLLEEKYPDKKIAVLHASMSDILTPSKSKRISEQFWKRLTVQQEIQVKYRNCEFFPCYS